MAQFAGCAHLTPLSGWGIWPVRTPQPPRANPVKAGGAKPRVLASSATRVLPRHRGPQDRRAADRWLGSCFGEAPVSHIQEGLMKRLLACAPLAVALALAGCDGTTATDPLLRPSFDRGGGQGVNLRAGGFGEGSLGAWKSQEGLPDSKGGGNFALYLQKMTATATVAAGFAVITGVEGQHFSELSLSWLHRDGGWCGAGAPRWNVGVTGASGTDYTVDRKSTRLNSSH